MENSTKLELSRDDNMKHIVIRKSGNVSADFSCENIIRFTAKLYKYSDSDVIVNENFIIARVPDKTGDIMGAAKFFELCDMVVMNPPDCTSFEEMEIAVKKSFVNKIDVGHSLILVTVGAIQEPDSYCFY